MNRIRRALRAFKLAFRTSPPSFEELRDVWPQFNQPAKQQNLYAAIFETSSERARSQHVRSFKDVERAADGALAIRIPYSDPTWEPGTRIVQESETGAWRPAEPGEHTPLVTLKGTPRAGGTLVGLADASLITEDEPDVDAEPQSA